jgi:hypothetical protein
MSLEYKTPGEAFELAGQRLRDTALQDRVASYLGGVWPAGFEEVPSPVAVYAPYLAKGSETEVDFLQKAAGDGFVTMIVTYEDTKYVTTNPAVVDCYRPPLKLPKGQRKRDWIVPEAERPGSVGDALTVYPGLDIISYWRGIRMPVLEENKLPVDDTVVDFGAWYGLQAQRFGWSGQPSKAPFYYMAAMALYASGRAVLFDTPPTAFASQVMKPAYDATADNLGVEPLVTNVLRPDKRDWTDLSFLDETRAERLLTTGSIRE